MFNPAYPFTGELLASFKEKEVLYFVKSTYKRGLTKDIKSSILISHYHDKTKAKRHYDSIIKDAERNFYDISKPEDFERLKLETAAQKERKVYSTLIHPENEKRADNIFSKHAKRYLHRHTNWNLANVRVYPKFKFIVGELYVRLVHPDDQITIKFEDIEKS